MTLHPLDLAFYKACNPDLSTLSDDETIEHFHRWGVREGRPGAAASMREHFLALIPQDAPVLEIGPFMSPVVTGPNVSYADVLDTEHLRKRAVEIGGDPSTCPTIHHVLPNMDLDSITDRFQAIVSSHNIEHQPDLVRHLIMAQNLLSPGGRYFLLAPDKRYCFDHFLAETTIADVMTAYSRAARIHDLGHVIEHRAMTTHNDTARHWAGDHGAPVYETHPEMLDYALREHRNSAGGYVDVHAWKFTPQSFATLIGLLHQIGLIRLRPTAVYNTVRSRNEFCAILTLDAEL